MKVLTSRTRKIPPWFFKRSEVLQCSECTETFVKYHFMLMAHMKNVHPGKVFTCFDEHCGLNFASQPKLEEHQIDHHNECLASNRTCEVCNPPIIFESRREFLTHQWVNHTRFIYYCPRCPEQFPEIKDAETHLRESHATVFNKNKQIKTTAKQPEARI